jgi:tetratricopeptide (TPR) repeat protein
MLLADTARHNLPAYYMLRAFSDYWSEGLENAGTATREVLRRAVDPLIVSRYDLLRVAVGIRLGRYPSEQGKTLARVQGLIARKDTSGAVELLAADRGPVEMAAVTLLRGNLALSRGDTVGALSHYAAAWLADPLTVDACLRSAEIWRARRDLRSAAEVLQRALDEGNDYWLVFYTLGMTCLEDHKPPGALRALESAQAIMPRSYETAIALGLTYEEMGDVRRARDYYNRAISIDPLRTEAVDSLTKLKRINRPSR